MNKSNNSLDHQIMRQLINPSLDMNLCEKIIEALDGKSTDAKKKLLTTLKKNMDNFKERAKDFVSTEIYDDLCIKIKDKIQLCEKYFEVTLADILSLIDSTDIRLTDVGWEYLSPQSIAAMIEENVIGQHNYSQALSLCTYLHLLRCKDDKADYPKMNLLVYGPTGVGKTYSVQVLAKKLKVDFEIVNCNVLVQEGIVGVNISDALTQACIKNKNFTHLIIFFDEFDKLFKDGHYNERILQEFLCYLDDNGEISYRTSFERDSVYKKFPTRNIMIIIGGVFDMLESIVSDRMCQQKVGFNSTPSLPKGEFYQYVTKEDFSKIFHSNELLGRIGQFVQVASMTKDMLYDILMNENASPLLQYQNYFAIHNISVELAEDGAQMIVDIADKQCLGVRGLKSILSSVLKEDMMQVTKNIARTIVVDKSYVTRHLQFNRDDEQS